MTESDRILVIVPMFHANAWGTPYAGWLAGADLLMPQQFLQGEHLARIIAEQRPTMACGVPTIWNDLLRVAADPRCDLSSLRLVLAGGSAVPRALIEAFERRVGVALLQGWGMTEIEPAGRPGVPTGGVPARGGDGLPGEGGQGRARGGGPGRGPRRRRSSPTTASRSGSSRCGAPG